MLVIPGKTASPARTEGSRCVTLALSPRDPSIRSGMNVAGTQSISAAFSDSVPPEALLCIVAKTKVW